MLYVIGINRVHTLTTIGMRLLRTVAASGTEVVFPLRFLHDCSHKHECHQSSLVQLFILCQVYHDIVCSS